MANMYKGITIPVTIVEGNITIKDTVSVNGNERKPTLSNQAYIGEAVAIVNDFRVEKATGSNGTIIGFVHDEPQWSNDPTVDYTKAQAITAGMLRECGVETKFTDVREVTAKAGEGIKAGDYVKFGADGQLFEKSTTATDMIALSGQDNENRLTIAR